jgi:hypothetical protein
MREAETLPPSGANYLEIWESQLPGTPWDSPGLYAIDLPGDWKSAV